MPHFVYLDHNATVPMKPAARAAVEDALSLIGNPSSVHRYGRAARRLIEDSREKVAALVGVSPAAVVFTSGATEANALAIGGLGRRRVLVAATEHASVLAAAPDAERIAVERSGLVDLGDLERRLAASPEPALVSVMMANNETGVIQPLAEVSRLARRFGALVHTDAVQAAGRVPLQMEALGVASLALSAHKLGGPAGVGALVVDPALPLTALLMGGGQERGRRAGTENLPGIAGFGAAAEAAHEALADQPRLGALRQRLESNLRAAVPGVVVVGADAPRLANTSCITMPAVAGETQVIAFDLAGVAVSAGAACSSGKVAASRVLSAMGVGEEIARCAIRVSLGWTTTEADIEAFIAAWLAIHGRAGRERQRRAGADLLIGAGG
ncbi:MAG: cysteine desulfurase family protein [Rhodospirillales bacterium]